MKVGDTVIRDGDKSQTWRIVDFKSDSRAYWIQLDGDHDASDVWHNSNCFEVISESLLGFCRLENKEKQ